MPYVDSDVVPFETGSWSAVFSGSVNAAQITIPFAQSYGSAPQFGILTPGGGNTLFAAEIESIAANQIVAKVFYTPGGNAPAGTVTGTWAVLGLPGT